MSRADSVADRFDAEVFTGDAFHSVQDAHTLLRFALRWAAEAAERIEVGNEE